MHIHLLDKTSTADAEALYQLFDESQRVEFPDDPPVSRRSTLGRLQRPWPGQRTEWWVGRVDDQIVGVAQLGLPELDNTETATAGVTVGVRHRRRGYGTELFEHVLGRAKAEHRVRVIVEVREPLPGSHNEWAGAPFAERLGFKPALREVRRRLHVDRLDSAALQSLARRADEASADYRIVSWQDRAPDDLVDGIAYLEGRMSVDPPLGDLHWEPEVFDADRIRKIEDTMLAVGRRNYCTAAVAVDSGDVVGYTMYVLDGDVHEHAWQSATIVLTEHRGHRLGMRLKLVNLEFTRAHEPELRTIDTWNAEENSHMVAVNDAMGFVPIELGAEWQLDL